MQHLDLTLDSPAANLACDEALLDACDDQTGGEVLRFWEPEQCFVVVGYSNDVAREVNVAACHQAGIGILRRCSGGGTVLQGPGCLNYCLIVKTDGHPSLKTITGANRHIMARHRDALARALGQPVEVQGFTDLTIGGLKFSGNAQRRKRHALVFHGTFLLRFDLGLMERFLPVPSRQPDYRKGRPHDRFLTNLGAPAAVIKSALREAWAAHVPLVAAPDCRKLIAEKYSQDGWNLRIEKKTAPT
jgi:lipoate-protein ligase A